MRSLSRRIPIKGRGYDLSYKGCGPLLCNLFTFVCEKTGEAVTVDPSTHDVGEFEEVATHLQNYDVKHILLTHGHADHVSGVTDVMSTWPNAKLHLHPLEEENYQLAKEQGRMFGLQIPTLPQPTNTLKDGDIIKVGETIKLNVVNTPGHAPGHVSFVDDRSVNIDSGESNADKSTTNSDSSGGGGVIIGGDLLFRGSVGRTDFFNSSMDDLLASVRRLYERYDERSIVLSGHTTATYLKEEKETNPFVMMALQRPKDWYDDAKERNGWK